MGLIINIKITEQVPADTYKLETFNKTYNYRDWLHLLSATYLLIESTAPIDIGYRISDGGRRRTGPDYQKGKKDIFMFLRVEGDMNKWTLWSYNPVHPSWNNLGRFSDNEGIFKELLWIDYCFQNSENFHKCLLVIIKY